MKKNWNQGISIVLPVLVLTMAMLVGCGTKNSVEISTAPTATADVPAGTAEPVSSPVIETAVTHQPGDRYEGSVTLDGVAETVRYEQIRNDRIGFEMGYNYERFERYSEPARERFILTGDNLDHPEVYLEVTRRAEDAETAASSIMESLSNVYNPTRSESALDHAGSCIEINADVDKNGQMTIDQLQAVYIIPAPDGCLVAWAHNTMDSADAFGALFRNMMHTFVVLEEHDPIADFSAVPAESAVQPAPAPTPVQNQGTAPERFTGVMGTEFVVPEGFIQLDESPNIGYQYTFWHPDYEIRIVVCEIAPGYIPEGAYETDYNIAEKNPDVTYFNHGENWFVQSGYNNNGEEIFYSKERNADNGLKSFWITYPTAKREFGDRITAEFEANLRF